MSHLGARLTHVGPGRVHIVLPARPEVTQQHGYVRAGATSAIADSAGGYAALTLFSDDSEVLTVEYKINLLAPAAGDHLEAIGTVLKPGRTLAVCFLAGDHHGTSGLAIDATTQAVVKRYFTPFGAARGTAAGNWPDDKEFLGKPADPGTGLTHIGAREFDPTIGRFLGVDPLLESDKHQSLNGYAYAENNPVSLSDPTGLGAISCSGSSCSPEMIAADEVMSPPIVQSTGGGGNGSGGTSSASSGNVCGPKCQAAIMWQQWERQRILALRQQRADQIRMLMYGTPAPVRILAPMDMRGCNEECRTEFMRLQISDLPAVSSSDRGFSLFDPVNEWGIAKGQAMRRGYELLKKPETQSELLGEMYEDVAELSGGTCKDKGKDLTLCTTGVPLYGRGGTTIGDTYVTEPGDPVLVDGFRLKHERKHVKQWEKRGVKFALDYFREGVDPCGNKYEEQAGYADGGYDQCVP